MLFQSVSKVIEVPHKDIDEEVDLTERFKKVVQFFLETLDVAVLGGVGLSIVIVPHVVGVLLLFEVLVP